MSTSLRRGSQLLALALASSTVVVAAGASVASAAPAGTQAISQTSLYSGTADSSAVQLILSLPAALTAVTGAVLPNPVDLSLIRNTGKVVHDGVTADEASTSASDLAQGSLISSSALSPLLQPVLQHTVTSSIGTPSPAAYSTIPGGVPSNPLGLNLALTPLTATTNPGSKATAANGGVATSALASLATLAPQLTVPLQAGLTTVNTQLTAALAQLTAALAPVGGAISPVTGALTTVVNSVPSIPIPNTPLTPGTTVSASTLLGPVTGDPVGTLTTTLNSLPALIASVEDKLLNGAALSIDGISSSEGIVPLGAGTSSTAAANVATINLFGGLIQVQATKASATATAPGAAGKAAADSSATLLKVIVGTDLQNLLSVIADDSGLSAGLLSATPVNSVLAPVLTTVNSAVAGALSSVTGLLQGLMSNAKILQQGTTSNSVTPDGTHAEAHATPAQVSIGLPGATNLVALSLGKVDVVAQQTNTLVNSTPATVKAPTVAKVPGAPAKPTAPSKKLAYTGADLPLTAGLALALLGAATVLTRRRRSNSGS